MMHHAREALLPLGRRWPAGPDEGAFGASEKVAPHQFGPMTYGCAMEVPPDFFRRVRSRKSWPHVLSPEGRGGESDCGTGTSFPRSAADSGNPAASKCVGSGFPLSAPLGGNDGSWEVIA